MIEEWQAIPNYEGLYEISSLGRVKSLDRVISRVSTFNPQIIEHRLYKSQILKPMINVKSGVYYIDLIKNKKRKRFEISRLVLTVFHRAPKQGEQACHFPNPDRSNNSIENLVWGTQKENELHKITHGTKAVGKKLPQTKITEEQAKEILILSKTMKEIDIIKKTGINRGIINHIRRGKTWKHINLK